ncbi:phospholipase A1-IIdelta-like [Salvia miltiorrhiza]|uniref:phospholipase A1-IIdelta-like n=1 Tax=Salvia miltiorrhiza TaxID=226208 RepID=UPI0025AC3604|nr:phospholipase A1-IIdelta-like [Salvia miltiorrhiza]
MEETVNDVVAEPPSWAELLGCNNWEGLLDPLDLSLRRFLLLCGDFCQCTYDAFDDDDNSPYAGSSRYGEKSFFHKVKFPSASAYQISSFLYATATLDIPVTPDRETSFIGYVATSASTLPGGRGEIYVVWRGTKTNKEWIDVAHFEPVPASAITPAADPAPNVMDGWLRIYTSSNPNSQSQTLSARDQLRAQILQLQGLYKDENLSIVVTGHSLGAALAVLSAFDLVENVVVPDIPVTAVVFGCPRVGDGAFVERLRTHRNLKILHAKNVLDPIPFYPQGFGYSGAGVEMVVDSRKSPWLRVIPKDLMDFHNLQGMLHVVAGWHGEEGEFEVAVKRSLALVNKSCAFLKDECKIPGSWWVAENRGMMLNEEGDWVLKPPLDDDCPAVPE